MCVRVFVILHIAGPKVFHRCVCLYIRLTCFEYMSGIELEYRTDGIKNVSLDL